jgi:hypothetical protein
MEGNAVTEGEKMCLLVFQMKMMKEGQLSELDQIGDAPDDGRERCDQD